MVLLALFCYNSLLYGIESIIDLFWGLASLRLTLAQPSAAGCMSKVPTVRVCEETELRD